MSRLRCPNCGSETATAWRCDDCGDAYCKSCIKSHIDSGCTATTEEASLVSPGHGYMYCYSSKRWVAPEDNYFWKGLNDHDL